MKYTGQPMKALDTKLKLAVLADGTQVPLTRGQFEVVKTLWKAAGPTKVSTTVRGDVLPALRRKGLSIINRHGWGYLIERATA